MTLKAKHIIASAESSTLNGLYESVKDRLMDSNVIDLLVESNLPTYRLAAAKAFLEDKKSVLLEEKRIADEKQEIAEQFAKETEFKCVVIFEDNTLMKVILETTTGSREFIEDQLEKKVKMVFLEDINSKYTFDVSEDVEQQVAILQENKEALEEMYSLPLADIAVEIIKRQCK